MGRLAGQAGIEPAHALHPMILRNHRMRLLYLLSFLPRIGPAGLLRISLQGVPPLQAGGCATKLKRL